MHAVQWTQGNHDDDGSSCERHMQHSMELQSASSTLSSSRLPASLSSSSLSAAATAGITTAIQLGIEHVVSAENKKPMRDLLINDFQVVETVQFPSEGGRCTPAHHAGSFVFKCYAPAAFRHFRRLYGINMANFLHSICGSELLELQNPGQSGSLLFRTEDDCFIVKTVSRREAKYLRRLLQQYYLSLTQNPRTLLPKFYGLYSYRSGTLRIRIVVMNNLLPSSVPVIQKYDLKGSTYKRRAGQIERQKRVPTLKDLDFLENNSLGFELEPATYDSLIELIDRDCLVLESFSIMDYSLLIGVCKMDDELADCLTHHPGDLCVGDCRATGLPAVNCRGERVILYIGIIDILQDYRLFKRMEHTMWSVVTDGDTVSVHKPKFYARRYQDFIQNHVFRRASHSATPRGSLISNRISHRHDSHHSN